MEREGHEYIPIWQLQKIRQCSNMVKYIELLLPIYRDEQIYNKMHCIPLASNRESHLLIKFCSVLIFTLL